MDNNKKPINGSLVAAPTGKKVIFNEFEYFPKNQIKEWFKCPCGSFNVRSRLDFVIIND